MKITGLPRNALRHIKENISFLAVLIATFLALALIVTLTFSSFYTSARKSAVTIGNMTVTQEARRIEDALFPGINTLLVSSYTVDSMLQRGIGPKEIEEYLVQETQGIITGIDPDFSGIYGVIQDVYVDGIGWKPEPGYDPYTRPWYTKAAEKNGELAIVSPYIDAQTGSVMVSYSKILCDGKSAISFDARLDDIYTVTETIQLNGEGFCFLADKNGYIVAHRDKGEVGKNYLSDPEYVDGDERRLIEQVYASSNYEEPSSVRLNGSNCMVFTHPVRDEWYVVLVVSETDLFSGIKTDLLRSILISLAIFALVGYFCTSNYINRKRAISYAENIRIDVLTGLNNRGEFDRFLNTTVSGISMENKLYLLLFDADGFKSINDRFGHQEGDRALRIIAKALMDICKNDDWFCARYGGDEFVIICKCDDESLVNHIVEKLNRQLMEAVSLNRLPYSITMSCGYACYNPETRSLTDLVDRADRNLYLMKAEKAKQRKDA